LLSVGNELLLGNTINTNAAWLASQATSVGAEVTRITTIGDNLPDISGAVRESLRRGPRFLILTGGIGPTFDDMTLRGVARAFGSRVKVDSDAVDLIRVHYARRFGGKPLELTKPRLKMATIPVGSVPIHNPVGTAPAVLLIRKGIQIFCLPGVPSEAQAIFQESILPKIHASAGGRVYLEVWLRIGGITESSLAPIIDRVMKHSPGVYIKSHPRGIRKGYAKIELHFSKFVPNRAAGLRTLRRAVSEMKEELRIRQVAVSVRTKPLG